MMNKLYNLKKLNEIAQGDEGFVQDMVITFVENVTEEIESIKKLKTLENWTAIAEIAHKLASNFAYLEAESLHALAVNIEKSVILNHNVSNMPEKTEQLCSGGLLLINELKKDFGI
jgi:HPt (histidine-containing phosphotransfer) domain-containing protein